MSIIVPHIPRQPQQHTGARYMWRVSCSCGWYALAGNREHCLLAINAHLDEEEPFPSYLLEDTNEKPDR